MSRSGITTGAVIEYSYLWLREAEQQETEGRKPRPVAVGLRLRDDRVLLFPITSQPPRTGSRAVEIPEAEKHQAGLEPGKRLWIVLDECNLDVIGRSYYLTADPPLGHFSKPFFAKVLARLADILPHQVNRQI